MTSTKTLVLVTTAVTALGIAGSLYDLDDKIAADFPILAPYIEHIEFAFLAILVFLTGALSIALFSKVQEIWRNKDFAETGPMRRRMQHFSCIDMKADDLPEVMKIYSATTDGTTDLSVSREIYGRCKKGWKKIVDTRTGKLVGYFIVLPLSKRGEKAILEKEFDLNHPNITNFFNMKHRNGSAIYIGMVGAVPNDRDAKAFALNRLKYFVNSSRFSKVYARAATGDGLRLVRKQSFKKVFAEDRTELGVMFVKEMA